MPPKEGVGAAEGRGGQRAVSVIASHAEDNKIEPLSMDSADSGPRT